MAFAETYGVDGFEDNGETYPPYPAGPPPDPVSSIVGAEGEAQISLLTPTRLYEPAEFHSPPRASHPTHGIRTTTFIVNQLFARLKSDARPVVHGSSLSAKADYSMLSAASKRSGDRYAQAVQQFNLGVTNDNNENYSKSIECYKKFLLACPAAPQLRCLGLNAIAISHECAGDLSKALAYHAEHAKVATDNRNRVVALCNAGLVHRKLGNLPDSDACFERALQFAQGGSAGGGAAHEGKGPGGDAGGDVPADPAGEMLAWGQLGLNASLRASRGRPAVASLAGASPAAVRQVLVAPPVTSAVLGTGSGGSTGSAGTPSGKGASHGGGELASCAGDSSNPERTERGIAALGTQLQMQQAFDDPRNTGAVLQALGVLAQSQGGHNDAARHFVDACEAGTAAGDSVRAMASRCSAGVATGEARLDELLEERAAAAFEARAESLEVQLRLAAMREEEQKASEQAEYGRARLLEEKRKVVAEAAASRKPGSKERD